MTFADYGGRLQITQTNVIVSSKMRYLANSEYIPYCFQRYIKMACLSDVELPLFPS